MSVKRFYRKRIQGLAALTILFVTIAMVYSAALSASMLWVDW